MFLREFVISVTESIPNFKTVNENGQAVTHLFEVETGKVRNEKLQKLVIELVDCESKLEKFVRNYDNIGIVCVLFDFDHYWAQKDNKEKKRQLLDALYAGIKTSFFELEMDLSQVTTTYRNLSEDDLETEFTWGKRPKWNKSRTMKAEVFYLFNMDSIDLGLRILSKDNKCIREAIYDKYPPHFMFIEHMLGKLTWTSSQQVSLISKTGDEEFNLCVDS